MSTTLVVGGIGAFLVANIGFITSFTLAAGFSFLFLYVALPHCPIHIHPVESLNVPKYRGEWYEMYRTPGEEFLGRDCGRY